MFGGFNEDYFNDLHFINVCEGLSKPRKYYKNYSKVAKFIDDKSTSDVVIRCRDGQ